MDQQPLPSAGDLADYETMPRPTVSSWSSMRRAPEPQPGLTSEMQRVGPVASMGRVQLRLRSLSFIPVIGLGLVFLVLLSLMAHGGSSIASSASTMQVQHETATTVPSNTVVAGVMNTPTAHTGSTSTPDAKTPAPKTHVTITFKRTTTQLPGPNGIMAAADGSGDILAHQAPVHATGSSVPLNAFDTSAAGFQMVTLTVNNPTNTASTSQAGITIHGQNGHTNCVLYVPVSVPANGQAQQQCRINFPLANSTVWNDTASNPPFIYSGQSPNMAAGSTYWVPPNCGPKGYTLSESAPIAADVQASQLAWSQAILFGNTYQYSPMYCKPAAGTIMNQTFTFIQYQDVTGTVDWALESDLIGFLNTSWFSAHAPANFVFLRSTACTYYGLIPGSDTPTRSTMTCSATGTFGWNWTQAALAQVVARIAGQDSQTATKLLNTLPGIASGSVVISPGISALPASAIDYTFVITP